MSTFLFYKEFENGHSRSFDMSRPDAKISTSRLPVALSTFAKSQKINLVDQDKIDNKHLRAYFVKKKFFGKGTESIYFISIID